MGFPRSTVNSCRESYVGSMDDIFGADSDNDLVFERRPLADTTKERHRWCLGLWKEYCIDDITIWKTRADLAAAS